MGVRTSFLSFDIFVYLFFLIFIFKCVFYMCYSSKATLATVIAAAVLLQCRVFGFIKCWQYPPC